MIHLLHEPRADEGWHRAARMIQERNLKSLYIDIAIIPYSPYRVSQGLYERSSGKLITWKSKVAIQLIQDLVVNITINIDS